MKIGCSPSWSLDKVTRVVVNSSHHQGDACLLRPDLIDSNQCAGKEAEVMSRIDFLKDQWEKLVDKTKQKTQKLKEAGQELQFNTAAKDMDFWLAEVCYQW